MRNLVTSEQMSNIWDSLCAKAIYKQGIAHQYHATHTLLKEERFKH